MGLKFDTVPDGWVGTAASNNSDDSHKIIPLSGVG